MFNRFIGMKTNFKTIGASLLLFSTGAVAQTAESNPTVVVTPDSGVNQSPGIEMDRSRNAMAAPVSINSSAVGIIVKSGKAYLMRAGQLTLIDKPLSLTVSPDGAITGFDGKTISLPEGQMLTMDGRLTAISDPVANTMVPGLSTPTASEATAKANQEMAEANSKPAVSNISQAPGTDLQGSTGGPTDKKGGGGSGNANRPRNSSDNSSNSEMNGGN